MENIVKNSSQCCFCNLDRELIIQNESSVAFYDKFPVSKGHSIVIPKKHISNYFDLSEAEQQDCWKLINEMKIFLTNKYNPDGFNVGININESAGQTVMHAHIHLIPRYRGDVQNPRGGIRHLIPGKGDY